MIYLLYQVGSPPGGNPPTVGYFNLAAYWLGGSGQGPAPIPPVTSGGQWSDGDPLAEGYRRAWEFAKKLRQGSTGSVGEAAAELGRKGGLARAKNMTPIQRSQLASHAAKTRWK